MLPLAPDNDLGALILGIIIIAGMLRYLHTHKDTNA